MHVDLELVALTVNSGEAICGFNQVVEQREDCRKLIIFHFSLFPK